MADAGTEAEVADAAIACPPSEAVTWQVYDAPGVSPVTVIGELVPVA